MAIYAYTAVDENGSISSGLVEAADEFEALKTLKEKDLQVLNLKRKSFFFSRRPEDKTQVFLGKSVSSKKEKQREFIKTVTAKRIIFKRSINYYDFVVFLREFAVLITSGIDVITSLTLLAEHSSDIILREALVRVVQNLNQGVPIDRAFSRGVKIFPEVFLSMIQAGVISGNLPKILRDLADYYEKELKVRKKFIASMTYPIMVLFIAFFGIFFLVNYIFPGFINIFKQLNLNLPLPTKILIYSVNFFKDPLTLLSMIVIAAGIFIVFSSYIKTPFGRYQYDWFKIKIPVFGNILKKIMLCRFSRTLGTLYENGINLSYALDITCDVIDNKYYQEEIKKMKDEVLHSGNRMHEVAASKGNIFPPVFSHFVSIGEETGNLGAMLKKATNYFEVEIFYIFDNFIVIIEPLVIAVLGGIVLFIILSLFLPLYSVINQMTF